jgi:hypothetical protein
MRITALSVPHSLWPRLQAIEEPKLTPREAAALTVPGYQMPLTGRQREAWLEERVHALFDVASGMVDSQTLARTALVVVASRLPAGAIAPETDGGPRTTLTIATADRDVLHGERESAIRQALLAFLRNNALLNSPVLIDCEVDDDRAVPGQALSGDRPMLRLDRMKRVEATGRLDRLGDLFEAPDGRRWALRPYVSEDASRREVLAANLSSLSGAEVLEMRLAAAPGGLIHVAVEAPGTLEILDHPLEDAAVRASFANGIATDAWLVNLGAYYTPTLGIGKLGDRAMRMDTQMAMAAFGRPPWNGFTGGESVVRDLYHRLAPISRSPFERLLAEEITLPQVADNIRGILRVSDDVIRELAGDYGLLDSIGRREQIANLIARRDVLGTLSFLDRVGLPFYEDGTAPDQIRGKVVSNIVRGEIRDGQPVATPRLKPVSPSRRGDPSKPRIPDAAVIDAVQRLVRDPEFIKAPMSRGGVRWVYPIPGHPFVFKLSRRGAEAVVRWRQQYGGGEFPDWALAEGQRYAQRLNERHLRMVDHLGSDVVYAEHAMVIPDVDLPVALLTDLEEHFVSGRTMTVPILGTIQSLFTYIEAPNALQCRFPYAEWNGTLPDFGAAAIEPKWYWAGLHEWVLNLPWSPPSNVKPIDRLLLTQPRSTAAAFLRQCDREPALHDLATRFWTDLIGSYCSSTGESADTSGPDNAFWYLNDNGERGLALVDFLYPDDAPILLEVDGIMRRFLYGEPLTLLEKAHLLNAINFARGANFMASELGIEQRIDLFPDNALKHTISERSDDVFRLLNSIRFEKPQPHPDKPWGIY